MKPRTLADLFLRACETHPKPDRFLHKRGGAYVPVSTDDFRRDVFRCARALEAAGVRHGDRVALLSYNCVEWATVDYACQLLGAPTVPLYTTLPAEQCAHIINDSGARILFIEDARQHRKIRDIPRLLPGLERIVSFKPVEGVEPFADFLAENADEVEPRVGPDDLATLIYTSGTTGEPKGAMLTHGNIVSNVLACAQVLPLSSDDVILSFLPVAHVFERLADYLLFHIGATIAYCERVEKAAQALPEVRPTLMVVVPRFLETICDRIRRVLSETKGFRRWLADRAIRVGEKAALYRMTGRPLPPILSLRRAIARKLVLSKFQERTGDRLRMMISGGAALPRDVCDFLWSLGFTVL
ncbi:MAG: AMP-dependent synthetase/ligase, partial [Planctomycetota bacterium]